MVKKDAFQQIDHALTRVGMLYTRIFRSGLLWSGEQGGSFLQLLCVTLIESAENIKGSSGF